MFSAILAMASLATAQGALYSNHTESQLYMWNSYKAEYGRTYSASDEPKRFATFLDNLKVIDERNQAERGSAVHGINKFTDMSQEEFASRFLLSRPPAGGSTAKVATVHEPVNAAAGLVDWTGTYTTVVKNQGYCGSCWAFSAVEQIESDVMRTLGKSYTLSPEQVVDCDNTSYGCSGGWTERAYSYVNRAGGIETEASYPYTAGNGRAGSCSASASKEVVTLSTYYTIKGESSMASYVQNTGPLSVCVCADQWNSYTGGVMQTCCKSIDHCVQAVGIDASSNGYWVVRNSWGLNWGESGHIRLAYGHDTCGITNDPTYTVVGLK